MEGRSPARTYRSWERITAGYGSVDSLGSQFLVLDYDGRIRLDYQFIEKPPIPEQ